MFNTKTRLTKKQRLLLVLRAIFEYPFVKKTNEFNDFKLYDNLKHYVYHRLLVEESMLLLSNCSKPKSDNKISEETIDEPEIKFYNSTKMENEE